MSGGAGQALVDDTVAANLAAVRARIAAAAAAGRARRRGGHAGRGEQGAAGRAGAGRARGRAAGVRRELRAGGEGALAGAARPPSRCRAAHDRADPDQQGQGRRRPVRRDRDGGSAEARARAGRGDGAAGTPAGVFRAGQHRRGAAEGGGPAGRCRRLHRGVPPARAAGGRPDGDPAGGRGAVACTSRCSRISPDATASTSSAWA